MNVLDRARLTIREHHLATPDARIVAALSGGSDSVALCLVLKALHEAGELRLIAAAHFNHQLRPGADADEAFCREFADSLGLPFVADREDVAARARRQRQSIEVSARAARYAFFERVRRELGADAVALGHTRDDEAETFLLRLLRGAGARGLAAMYPRNGPIIRPLIECRRGELRQYLESRDVRFVEDGSNGDVSIARNRVRVELLPILETRFNPKTVDVLADAASIARDEHDFLVVAVEDWWRRFAVSGQLEWRLDAEALSAAPLALARMVLWRAMREAAHGQVTYRSVGEALAVARGERGPLHARRLTVERAGASVVLRGRDRSAKGRPEPAGSNFFSAPLSIPGEVVFGSTGAVVSAEVAGAPVPVGNGRNTYQAAIRLDRVSAGLSVRTRRPGDRFRPAGGAGRRKLQDFFVDRKVGREARDRVPLVVDAGDRIVWVAGHAVDEAFRVTDPAQAVIILRLKAVGGSA